MYSPDPDMTHLRQGDVISDIYLPRFNTSNVSFLHGISSDGSLNFKKRAIVDSTISKAVVLSQCCEFNPGKRKAFSVALLLPVKKMFTSKLNIFGINIAELIPLAKSPFRGKKGRELDQIDRLRTANVINLDTGHNDAVNVFLFEADGEKLTEPYVADFSRVTSCSIKDLNLTLGNKVLQLDNEGRRLFQLKLAYFYGRSAEEI